MWTKCSAETFIPVFTDSYVLKPPGYICHFRQMLPWSAWPLSSPVTLAFSWKTWPNILNDKLAQSYYKTLLIPHTAAPRMQTAADSLQFETPPFCLSCEKYENSLWAPWKAVSIVAMATSCQVCVFGGSICVLDHVYVTHLVHPVLAAVGSLYTQWPPVKVYHYVTVTVLPHYGQQWLNKDTCVVIHRNSHIWIHAFDFFFGMSGNSVCFSTHVSCRISRMCG